MAGMSNEEFAKLRARVEALESERSRYIEAPVQAIDTGSGTFSVELIGEYGTPVTLSGLSPRGPQFMPAVGEMAKLALLGSQIIHHPGSIAEDAITNRELDQGVVDTIQLALDTADGKNRAFISELDPNVDGTTVGDIWWKIDATTGVATGAWRWDGVDWNSVVFGNQILDSLTAAKITTGTLAVGVKITVGDPLGSYIEIGGPSGDIVFYVMSAVDGVPNEIARLGRNSGGIDPVTGEQTWSITDAGDGSFRDLLARSITVGGTSLLDLIEDYSRGTKVWFGSGKNQSSIVNEFGLAEVYFPAEQNRNYVITFGGGFSSTNNNGEYVLRMRATTDGSRPLSSSTLLAERYVTHVVGGRWQDVEFSQVFQRDADDPIDVHLLLTIARGGGQSTGSVSSPGTPPFLRVEDRGAYRTPSGTAANDGAAGGSPAAPQTRQVYSAFASWSRTFRGDGSIRSDTTDLVQGYNSVNGDGKAMIGWPSLTSMLSGATIESVKVYLYAYHWYLNSGGTAIIGTHSQTAAPAVFSGTTNRMQSAGWPKPGQRAIDLTAYKAEFQAGTTRGVVLGPSGGTNLTYYGRFAGATDAAHPDLRPRLEIVYYK